MEFATRDGKATTLDNKLGALFPVDMGNYGRNRFPPRSMFLDLKRYSPQIPFIGYHRRASGNFVFEQQSNADLDEAVEIAQRVTKLRCIARSFRNLADVREAVPSAIRTPRGSVVLQEGPRVRRVVFVAVSKPIISQLRVMNLISPRVEVVEWVSASDVVCLYDRPKAGGDVGQVTGALLRALRRTGLAASLIGTGRALSVVYDLLDGRYETS